MTSQKYHRTMNCEMHSKPPNTYTHTHVLKNRVSCITKIRELLTCRQIFGNQTPKTLS